MGEGLEFPFEPAAPLRHSMEIAEAWMCPEITAEEIKKIGYKKDTFLDKVIPTNLYADIVYQSPSIFRD